MAQVSFRIAFQYTRRWASWWRRSECSKYANRRVDLLWLKRNVMKYTRHSPFTSKLIAETNTSTHTKAEQSKNDYHANRLRNHAWIVVHHYYYCNVQPNRTCIASWWYRQWEAHTNSAVPNDRFSCYVRLLCETMSNLVLLTVLRLVTFCSFCGVVNNTLSVLRCLPMLVFCPAQSANTHWPSRCHFYPKVV